jgi:glucan-binding YG repeat protein
MYYARTFDGSMKRREVNLIRNSWYLMRQMKMLNMGFLIHFILSKSDGGRKIWLFSATMAKENPAHVDTTWYKQTRRGPTIEKRYCKYNY